MPYQLSSNGPRVVPISVSLLLLCLVLDWGLFPSTAVTEAEVSASMHDQCQYAMALVSLKLLVNNIKFAKDLEGIAERKLLFFCFLISSFTTNYLSLLTECVSSPKALVTLPK